MCLFFSRFGELNIPSVIEAALRKLQEQAQERSRVMGNVRSPGDAHSHGPGSWEPPHSSPDNNRSPFSGGVIDLSKISLERNNRGPSSTSRGPHDSHHHPGEKKTSTPAIAPPDTWDTSSLSQGGSGRGNPFVQNNDILRMKSSFRFDGPTGRKTGSNLRTFEDKSPDTGIQTSPTTPVPGEIQNLFERLNIANLDSLGAQLDAFNAQPADPIPASVHTGTGVVDTQATKTSGVIEPFAPMPPNVPVINSPHDTKPVKSPIATINQTATVNATSANSNSSSNSTSTKKVKTKTIKVTTVVKGGTSADVAAAAASQAEIANAVAQGKDINSSSLADIAAAANSKVTSKVAGGKYPVGSITVKRQKNGESIITLSDGQGEPVVLRASGPVKIERIVKPNGKVQFLINPVKPAPQTSTIDPAESDVESEDLSTVGTLGTNQISFSSTITSPIPLVTKVANAVVKEALVNGASELTGTDNSKTNNAFVDAAIEQALSHFVSLPLETTTIPVDPSTMLITPVTGTNNNNNAVSANHDHTNNVPTNSLGPSAPVDNAFSPSALVDTTNPVGATTGLQNSPGQSHHAKQKPDATFTHNTVDIPSVSSNTNQISNLQSTINNNGVMQLFPVPNIPKIPPPPRVIGSLFDSSGNMNSFFMPEMALFSGPHVLDSLPFSQTLAALTTTTIPPPALSDINSTNSLHSRPDIMPKYDLINNVPNVDFASHSTHG